MNHTAQPWGMIYVDHITFAWYTVSHASSRCFILSEFTKLYYAQAANDWVKSSNLPSCTPLVVCKKNNASHKGLNVCGIWLAKGISSPRLAKPSGGCSLLAPWSGLFYCCDHLKDTNMDWRPAQSETWHICEITGVPELRGLESKSILEQQQKKPCHTGIQINLWALASVSLYKVVSELSVNKGQ